jgi:DNA excision repair protein ERCC-4
MAPVPPPMGRLAVKRDGKDITKQVPLPVVIVDTREQTPLEVGAFPNWIGGVERRALATGDYSVVGFENEIAIERKSLSDLVSTLLHNRARFLAECERLACFRHRGILIEATYETVKSPYTFAEGLRAHPNGVAGSLDGIEARWSIPITYAGANRLLAAEKLASMLSKAATLCWLERNGMGRFLQDGDI